MWKEIDDENIDYMMGMNQRVLLSVKHLTTRLIVVAGNRGSYLTVQSPYPVECNDLEWIRVEPLPVGQWHLTRQDEILLLSTIAAHPLGQYKKKIEQEKEATLRRVRMTEHFVKMGCGESPKGIEVKKD